VEYGILGPLAVWKDGRELRLGPAKQRAVLALLVLRRNELVPTERLMEDLWGEKPPPTALKALRNYVSQLRKSLGAGVLETRPLGYVLQVEKDKLDVDQFEQMLEHGRRLLAQGGAEEASDALREALAIWRGPPLADFRYEAFARDEIARLEELRLIAHEQRLEADLARGRHAQAVPELEVLVRDHPLRESLRRLLMLALYRAGRQADALAAYQAARKTLVEELGLDPSESLQRLEKAILRQDAALDLAEAPAAAAPDAPPAPRAPPTGRAQRKLVTVLSAEAITPAEIDPEALQALLGRYLARASEATERHGGTVEELVGERLIAVFGLPAVHEDDAVRALRAALEIRDGLGELAIDGRIGLESGEVIVGGTDRVTGAAVTLAARLEQAAQPGEILVGDGTMRLARDAVAADPREPLPPTGKRAPVPAWRLVSVSAEATARSFDSPFVGRERELSALDEAWDRACTGPLCELVTIVGPAGVGKSRLVAEFATRSEAAVVRGRCLSYGTGITYWPVLEIVGALRPHLAGLEPATAAPLRALLGDGGSASTDEVAWAFRKLVETAARTEPHVVVFDDIHWAEETLLELIDQLAVTSSGAPIVLVCMARPELLERRPGWGGVVALQPLTQSEAELVGRSRLGGYKPDPDLWRHLVETSGGNPLFVEELATMLQEAAGAEVELPLTIQALLATRLDQLPEDERTVLEAAAVEGEVFHRAAVQTLVPEEVRLGACLTALVRKDFARPSRPEFRGEDGFRFRHLLVRDAAYESIPKSARSGLHERFADWLDERDDELDAFIGYHLEQAYRFRADVRDTGPETDDLAIRASERLEAAAGDALDRHDLSAAAGLLRRSAELPPIPDGRRARLLADETATLMTAGKLVEAESVLATASAAATESGEDCAESRVLVEHQFLEMQHATPGATEGVHGVLGRAIPVFERVGDQRGLLRAWHLQASADWMRGRVSAAEQAWERAAQHARLAGAEHDWAVILTWIASGTCQGAMPVEAAIARSEAIRRDIRGHPACEAEVLRPLAGLHGMAGRFDLARSLFATRNAVLDDLGRGLNYAPSTTEAFVETLAGNFALAEEWLRRGYDALEAMGENAFRSTSAALLARALLAQGRHDDAERFATEAEKLAEPEDVMTQMIWRGVRARVLATRGESDEAERLAREAVALGATTDLVNDRADMLLDLVTVLDAAGRIGETSALIAEAIRLYDDKGNAVSASAARRRLDALAPA
jgi:DNA-binding SARP family transcriptional activator